MASPYDIGLDKNPANFAPLTPLQFLDWSASACPRRTALVYMDRRFTWAETYARCRQLASALAKRGIGRGDTAAAMLWNTPEMFECQFGVPMSGAVLNTINIAGRMVYLWRAVDAEGEVLDVLVQSRRNKRAALKLMRKLLKKYGFVPDKLVTDDLKSYAAAASELRIAKRHERGRWRNNRAENSHQPTRRREYKMQGFKCPGSAQRFLSTHAATYNTFNVQRHLISARTHRAFHASAMNMWREAVAVV